MIPNKLCFASGAWLALMLSSQATAEAPALFNVNIGATSDYVFRGVSQTAGRPAVFAGGDAEVGRLYAGSWISNVEFKDGTDAEFDIYAGFKPQLGLFSLDLGAIYYGYAGQPRGADLDYLELKAAAALPVGPARFGAEAYFAPNYRAGIDRSLYYEVNGSIWPTTKVLVSAAVGRREVSGADDYTTWNVGVGYALTRNLGVDVRYHDTDQHALGKPYGSRLALSLKANF